MNVDFVGINDELPVGLLEMIKKMFSFIKHHEAISTELEVTVSFVNDQDIQKLNKQYRAKDEPTDVLSFPIYEREELMLDSDVPILLGDIIISIDRAKEQSKVYKHSELREFTFLAVHGLLHLIGYDHDTEDREQEMFALQNKVLKEHGLERM
ncbi:MAG TPA: rRNA maturation RNase YbeY [Bacillota bacterium]|nr:rRNA maturation RNase YbeY [Bacillota bacterium]